MNNGDRREWILIVDDDEDIRDVLTIILENQGYKTVGAFDGVDALERLRDHGNGAPSLVFLDLMMPRLSGVDFAKELRSRPEMRDVPIVILSGDSTALKTAESMDVAGCLTKPVDLRQLLRTLEQFARRVIG
jgi:CheY-like chemotaxis protein